MATVKSPQRRTTTPPRLSYSVGVPGTPTYRDYGAPLQPATVNNASLGNALHGHQSLYRSAPMTSQPSYRPPPQLTPVGPNLMGAAQQAMGMQQMGQNLAMQNAVAAGNQARVSGPLTGVYTMPVTPGSAHNQGIGGPNHAAMLAQHVAAAANRHMNPDPTYGGQKVLSDYVTDPVTGQRRLGNYWDPNDRAMMMTPGGIGNGGGGQGGGGANTGNSTLDNFLNQMQGARDQANAANEARYQEALGIRRAQQQMAEADINRAGQARAQEIRDNARRADADVVQNLTARGLANTTSAPVLRQGVQREAAKQQTQLGDLLARQRLDANQMLNTNVVDLIREKQDVGPNWDTMANLAMAAAQANSPTPQFPLGQLLSMLSPVQGIGQMPMGGGQPQMMMPQQQPQWQPFQMNGNPNAGGGGNAGGQGGAGNALGNVGASLGQYLSQLPGLLAGGIGGLMSGNAGLGNVGNALGGGITGAASSLSNWLGSLGIPQGGLGNTVGDWMRANIFSDNTLNTPDGPIMLTPAAQQSLLMPYFGWDN